MLCAFSNIWPKPTVPIENRPTRAADQKLCEYTVCLVYQVIINQKLMKINI